MKKQISIRLIRCGADIGGLWVHENEWASLNYIDYIDLDESNNLTPEFYEAHINIIPTIDLLLEEYFEEQGELSMLEFDDIYGSRPGEN